MRNTGTISLNKTRCHSYVNENGGVLIRILHSTWMSFHVLNTMWLKCARITQICLTVSQSDPIHIRLPRKIHAFLWAEYKKEISKQSCLMCLWHGCRVNVKTSYVNICLHHTWDLHFTKNPELSSVRVFMGWYIHILKYFRWYGKHKSLRESSPPIRQKLFWI